MEKPFPLGQINASWKGCWMIKDIIYRPYWWDAWEPSLLAAEDVDRDCDVVIVGAGYAGLSAALTLARAGRSVQIFDAGIPGFGASTRNGGIGSGNLRPSIPNLIKKFGPKRATEMFGESCVARSDLIRFIDEENIDCQFTLSGRFAGACQPQHFVGLERTTELLNQNFSIGATMVPKTDQHAEIGTEFYHGGMIRPDIGGLHPALFYKGILERTLQSGAKVHGQRAVKGLRRTETGFEVMTGSVTVCARDVIVCTNGYTDKSIPWLRRRLVPVASQILVTKPLEPGLMARLMPKRRMLTETRLMGHYYRPTPDGKRILFGGRTYGNHKRDQPIPYQHLYDDLVELFPELGGIGISHVWWGFVAFTMDHLPQLAKRDGIYYATGFAGSGTVWARWFGLKAAYQIIGGKEGASAFSDRIFKAVPFYEGRPWFLPAVQAWYSIRDKFGV